MASLTGVAAPTPAWPLGLVNTSRQIGGAIGLAAASTIAATSTNHYLHSHAALTPSSAVALDHGFQTALSVLTGLLLLGAAIAVTLIKPAPASAARPAPASHDEKPVSLEQAA